VLRLRFAEAVPEGVPRSGKAGAKRRRSSGSSLFDFFSFLRSAVHALSARSAVRDDCASNSTGLL